MATTDWNDVLQKAIAAAISSLGDSWEAAGPAATNSVQQLVSTAQYIAANAAKLDQFDQKLLTENQKLAMQNVLLGYEDIGIAAAEKAVAATWAVIQAALTNALALAV